MSKKYLASLLKMNGQDVSIDSSAVFDRARNQSVADSLAALGADLTALNTTVETFLTGDPDDNGTLDRLKELVAAINENKDTIEELLADKATKAELNEAVAALEASIASSSAHENKAVLDGLSANATSGNLVYNNVELGKFTGIAIASTLGAATDYSGQLQIVVEEYEAE